MLIPSIALRFGHRRQLTPPSRCRQRPWRTLAAYLTLWLALTIVAAASAHASLQQGGAAYKAGRFEAAFKHFLAEARKGTPVAQYLVASMYEEGRGALKSETLAASWYKLAADQGDGESQYALALQHLDGRGVVQSAERAAKLLKQAADGGLTSAMNRLGTLYLQGQGVKRDATRAVVLFKQAAKAGHLSARYNVGRAYLQGDGIAQDAAAAKHWLEIAALGQHPGAQLRLGTAFAQGRFGLVDEAIASAWMTLAAEQGLQLAKTNLDILDNRLDPGQRAKALEELKRLRARIRAHRTRSAKPTDSTISTTPYTE